MTRASPLPCSRRSSGSNPRSIALNYSPSDPAADGLTHGLWLTLQETLAGTPYADRLVSSEAIVNALRGRKSAEEVRRIRAAVSDTEEIFEHVTATLQPGQSELEIAAVMHEQVAKRGLGYAWGEDHCPAVNAGPDKDVGHSSPSELRLQRASCSMSTSASRGTTTRAISSGSGTRSTRASQSRRPTSCPCVGRALGSGRRRRRRPEAGRRRRRRGCSGAQDAVAAGFPEPMYALGHQLGRAAHDGGTLLGPRWDRYGTAPDGVVEEGNVFTLEYGTAVPGRGYIGLEEDVLVTSAGVEWLSTPQREFWLVR